jgi:hypothetical protein
MANQVKSPSLPQPRTKTLRPWYRIHLSTLSVLAIVLALLVFINIPGDRTSNRPYRFYHGWPYVYFERGAEPDAFWSFAGTVSKLHVPKLLGNVAVAICIVMLVACLCELWIRQNGRLFRFGIRSMLFVTAIVAVALGLTVRELNSTYRQQRALTELAQFGAVNAFRELKPHDWLRSFFGEYAHGRIHTVRFTATRVIDRLPDLRGLADVREMDLEILNVPEDIEQLAELPKLKYLSVKLQDETGRDKLRILTDLPQLKFLWLTGDAIDESTVAAIIPRSPISLRLDSKSVSEAALTRLAQSNSFTNITLHASQLQKPDETLLGLSHLRWIGFFGLRLSPQDEQRVRTLWPDAEITTGTYADTGEDFIHAARP